MEKRSMPYTLPLFGDLPNWDAPVPRPRFPREAKKAPSPPPPPPEVVTPAPIEAEITAVAVAVRVEVSAPPPVAPLPPPVALSSPVAPLPPPFAPLPPIAASPVAVMVALREPAAPPSEAPAPSPPPPSVTPSPPPPSVTRQRAPSAPQRFVEPDFPTPMPHRAPRSLEPDFPTPAPMPHRAPRSLEPDFPTPVPMPRRAPRSFEPDFPTPSPMPRRAPPSLEPDFPTPAPRRAPPSLEPDFPTPAPRSGRRAEEEAQVLSVADLDRRLKRVIEGSTDNVRVAGEVSNLKEVASGHIYFTLKDEQEEAAIDCVMYRTAPARSRRVLEDGARVVVRGRATVFVPRGRLQLTADEAQIAGRGALLEALERLKEKLAAEGLFDPARKRPLPRDPKVIGVVTSASGAAIHDILKVAFQRGAVRVILSAAPVQGRDAAARLARALAQLGRVREVEAIIVGRGGGSADDLSAFNEEVLAREAARCRVPVVSAVGHEVDISLLDLVADARAATPSQAAEMLVPDAAARRGDLAHLSLRMRRALVAKLGKMRAEVERREAKLLAFPRALAERAQRVDDAVGRLEREMVRRLGQRRAALQQTDRALWSRHPRAVIAAARHAIDPLAQRLAPAVAKRLEGERHEVTGLEARLALAMEKRLYAERASLARAAGRLDAMSPLAVLARGYAIATTENGRAVRSVSEVAPGDKLRVRVHDGALVAQVIEREDDDGDGDGDGAGRG